MKKNIITRLMEFIETEVKETGKEPEAIYISEELYDKYAIAISGETLEEKRKRGIKTHRLVFRDIPLIKILI